MWCYTLEWWTLHWNVLFWQQMGSVRRLERKSEEKLWTFILTHSAWWAIWILSELRYFLYLGVCSEIISINLHCSAFLLVHWHRIKEIIYLQGVLWKLTNPLATTTIWVARGASDSGIFLPMRRNCFRRSLKRSTWILAFAIFLVQAPLQHSNYSSPSRMLESLSGLEEDSIDAEQ